MFTTGADIYRANRERYDMARGQAGIGGPAGTNPIGDRPGTTTTGAGVSLWNTPVGRAHIYAVGAFALMVFLHVAAENRFAA